MLPISPPADLGDFANRIPELRGRNHFQLNRTAIRLRSTIQQPKTKNGHLKVPDSGGKQWMITISSIYSDDPFWQQPVRLGPLLWRFQACRFQPMARCCGPVLLDLQILDPAFRCHCRRRYHQIDLCPDGGGRAWRRMDMESRCG